MYFVILTHNSGFSYIQAIKKIVFIIFPSPPPSPLPKREGLVVPLRQAQGDHGELVEPSAEREW